MSVVVNAENHYKHRLARFRRPLYSDQEQLTIGLPLIVLFFTYVFLLIPVVL